MFVIEYSVTSAMFHIHYAIYLASQWWILKEKWLFSDTFIYTLSYSQLL